MTFLHPYNVILNLFQDLYVPEKPLFVTRNGC